MTVEATGRGGGGRRRLLGHTGQSMRPTLSDEDLLEVEPCSGGQVRVGDVVLFTPEGAEHAVVHRVVAVEAEGLVTRGDNNREVDPWRVAPAAVEGRVVAARRGRRRRLVAGGSRGSRVARRARTRRWLLEAFTPLLGPPYRLLAGRGLLGWLLPRSLRPRVVTFAGRSGPELHLLLGRRRIGRYDAGRRRWLVERPFRLLVDERALPHPDEQEA